MLLIAPLAIGLVWGTYLDDTAYVVFRYARNLATGHELTHHLTAGGQLPLRYPLYMLVLALLSRLGAPLPQAGLVLSGLGWGATALATYSAGRAMRRPVAAAVSATLVACSPIVVSTLGTEIPWMMAWTWIAVASGIKRRWGIQTAALALMLYTHFDLITLATAALMLIVQWIERRRFPLRSSLALAVVALGWGLMAGWQGVAPLPLPHPSLAEWTRDPQRLLGESEFYWLFLPLIAMGLLTATRKALWGGLLWGTVAALSGGAAAEAAVATLGLFLAGWGVEWIVQWIEARHILRIDRLTLLAGVVLAAGLPLGIAQASSLLHRYQFRPTVQQEIEGQAAEWLQAHSDARAIVLGFERIGYLADRATFPWDEITGDPGALAELVKALNEAPPDYCVSFRSVAWDRLTRTAWFQDGYTSLAQFESPYEAASPYTIWSYRFQGAAKPVGASFADQISLLSFRAPDSLSPGAEFDVRLYWEVLQPPEENYIVFIHLMDADGQLVANHNEMRLTKLWPPGEVTPDVHHVVPDGPMPAGTYGLLMGMYRWPSVERLPVWDRQGAQLADSLVVLQPVEVR